MYIVQLGAASVLCRLPSEVGRYWVDMEGPPESGKPSSLGSRLKVNSNMTLSLQRADGHTFNRAPDSFTGTMGAPFKQLTRARGIVCRKASLPAVIPQGISNLVHSPQASTMTYIQQCKGFHSCAPLGQAFKCKEHVQMFYSWTGDYDQHVSMIQKHYKEVFAMDKGAAYKCCVSR